ncbi:MAG TPA: rRNA maturation RNase YbeY, partial [Thermomicrobiales bacterium]|nr:rRNA maturation RNase YbeY [Thermomicrobiales bacterium]
MADLDLEFDVATEAPLPPGLDLAGWPRLARLVLSEERASGAWTIAVALVDDARIRALHRAFMDVDTATDVITFPAAAPGEPPSGGDIAISVERAQAQASDFGLSPAAETTFLLVHGLLHLCGWDDATPAERTRMLERGRA